MRRSDRMVFPVLMTALAILTAGLAFGQDKLPQVVEIELSEQQAGVV